MTQPVRFTVITDDPARAAQKMFGGADEVPPFVRIVTEPRAILDLPVGTLAMVRLFSLNSPAEVAYRVMRQRGALRFPDVAFLDRLAAWLDHRDAARLARAGAAVTGIPAPAAEEAAEPPRAAVPAGGKDAPRPRGAAWK